MNIQWFPGHMAKALREMQAQMKKVDIVLYLLDARVIASSFNHKFDEVIKSKKCLYIVNKCDLVNREDLIPWGDYFKNNNMEAIFISSNNKKDSKRVIAKLNDISKSVVDKYLKKGVQKTIRAIVIGMPNTGKSTFINMLAPSKKAITGNKAGVTRGIQFVKINQYMELYDTPGTLVPAFEDQKIAQKLAFVGSISDDVLDLNELALELIKMFKEMNYKSFLERFNQEEEYIDDSIKQLESVAVKRGYVLSKGRIDYDRASTAIILEFRDGKIGKIMLDKYE